MENQEDKINEPKGRKLKWRSHFSHCGCKVNQYETNAMTQKFIESGYDVVNFEEKSDVYIINTCTVTNIADRKSRQMLRRAKQLNPKAIIVAIRLLCANS